MRLCETNARLNVTLCNLFPKKSDRLKTDNAAEAHRSAVTIMQQQTTIATMTTAHMLPQETLTSATPTTNQTLPPTDLCTMMQQHQRQQMLTTTVPQCHLQ